MKSYILLSSNDYASLSQNHCIALTSVGARADAFTLSPHQFEYKDQAIPVSLAYMQSVYLNYDVCVVYHSCPVILSVVKNHPHLIVCHSGTMYRENHQACNDAWNPYVKVSWSDQTEFASLGSKNYRYIAPYATTTRQPKAQEGKLIIGHYPSNSEVKGTSQIIKMLEPFMSDFDIRIDTRLVSHEENVKRMSLCHIYVELFKPTLNGKEYGCMGVTGFEAAGLGCYVVTNNLHPEVYAATYGSCYFNIANTPEQFAHVFETYKTLQPKDYYTIATPDDFYTKHSLHATGRRLLEITQ